MSSRKSLKKAHAFNPRANNEWSKDELKFGQKMLEKMGWKKGQGIGLNHQGIADNIHVRLKLDNKGLGYKIKEDHWLEVRGEFSELLSHLNQTVIDENEMMNKEKKSLEAVSQSSRTRVHYHKFTHGKDIAKYKKEDLIGILGKKESEKSEVPDKKEFIQSGNMEDYFKNKMKKKRDTSNLDSTGNNLEHFKIESRDSETKEYDNLVEQLENEEKPTLPDNSSDLISKSEKKSKKKRKCFESDSESKLLDDDTKITEVNTIEQFESEENQLCLDNTLIKKSKKKQKRSENDEMKIIEPNEEPTPSENTSDSTPELPKKIKKKQKRSENDEMKIIESTEEPKSPENIPTSTTEPSKKIKKKRKHSENDETKIIDSNEEKIPPENTPDLAIEPPKKIKKKQKHSENDETKIIDSNEEKTPPKNTSDSTTELSPKIKKKRKHSENDNESNPSNDEIKVTESNTVLLVSEDNTHSDPIEEPKIKLKKKRKYSDSKTSNEEISDPPIKKKKKKSKNDALFESITEQLQETKSEQDEVKHSDISIRDSVDGFMKSVVNLNNSNSIEEYIKHFEKNRDDLLNKYREKYRTKFLLSSSENIVVYGDEFDGRKLDCKKPSSEDIVVYGDEFDGKKLDCKTPETKVRSRFTSGKKEKMSKAERIVAKARLLKNIENKTIKHNFRGSNLATIKGYGNELH